MKSHNFERLFWLLKNRLDYYNQGKILLEESLESLENETQFRDVSENETNGLVLRLEFYEKRLTKIHTLFSIILGKAQATGQDVSYFETFRHKNADLFGDNFKNPDKISMNRVDFKGRDENSPNEIFETVQAAMPKISGRFGRKRNQLELRTFFREIGEKAGLDWSKVWSLADYSYYTNYKANKIKDNLSERKAIKSLILELNPKASYYLK